MGFQVKNWWRSSGLALAVVMALGGSSASAWALQANDLRVKWQGAGVTEQDYQQAFAQAARNKFFHGAPPQHEVAALQRKVALDLADAALIAQEVDKRKIQADAAAIQKQLDEYDQRYAGSAQWQANRARLLPGLKSKLELDGKQAALEALIRRSGEPTEAQLLEFWKKHPDKFTTPEKVHLLAVLLKVDPSSPQSKWDAAKAEAESIAARAAKGADFAELARMHSADASASKGGDMGYLHKGMIPDAAQSAVDALKPGQVSDAVQILEGMAVFKLVDRQSAQLNPLEKVKPRARDLWVREQGDVAWDQFKQGLRKAAGVVVDETGFMPLSATGDKPAR